MQSPICVSEDGAQYLLRVYGWEHFQLVLMFAIGVRFDTGWFSEVPADQDFGTGGETR